MSVDRARTHADTSTIPPPHTRHRIVSRTPSGWCFWVSAPIWVACQSRTQAITGGTSARATARITTFRAVSAADLLRTISRSRHTSTRYHHTYHHCSFVLATRHCPCLLPFTSYRRHNQCAGAHNFLLCCSSLCPAGLQATICWLSGKLVVR